MEFEQILTLIDHVSESGLTSFQYEAEDLKLSMGCERRPAAAGAIPGAAALTMDVPEASAESAADGTEAGQEEKQGNLVKSPLVGTFYAAPAEDAEPFVKTGDTVKKGQVLAIVEAMKLMNEIESDFEGEVAEIYVKNGETVEYGQPLFRIV